MSVIRDRIAALSTAIGNAIQADRGRLDALEAEGRSWSMAVFDSDTDCAVGDGLVGFCVPAELDGMNITALVGGVHSAGTTGTMDIPIRRRRNGTDSDVLTTVLSVDSAAYSSVGAATPPTIDTANDDLATGDMIYIDVDAVHTTAAKGLTVTITAS